MRTGSGFLSVGMERRVGIEREGSSDKWESHRLMVLSGVQGLSWCRIKMLWMNRLE